MIVADTGAILALLDKGDRHHAAVRELYEERPDDWILPWAILPEVDYLVSAELGARAQEAFLSDIADGAFAVEYGRHEDIVRARAIGTKHRTLGLGLVDVVVMAIAERLRAEAIATPRPASFFSGQNSRLAPAIAARCAAIAGLYLRGCSAVDGGTTPCIRR